jgi:RimJ/RimL family protein N-acetyltransferase
VNWAGVTLHGDLVTLRPIDAGDTAAVWEMVNDPDVRGLTATTDTFTFEQVANSCASRSNQNARLDLAIIERATGEFAGEVVLNEYDATANTCNFRISLRGPKWFNRGLGSEATTLIVRHGLDAIGLAGITLDVLNRNLRARTVYEMAGFVETRTFDEDGESWVEMQLIR